MRRLTGRVLLAGLGVVLILSGVEHLAAAPALVAHYRAVNLPGVGAYSIGGLQLAAGVLLLFPRTQRAAAIGVGAAVLVVIGRQLAHAQPWRSALEAAAILAVCVAGYLLTRSRSDS